MPHQPVANLLTIRDVTRWAMTEMEKNSISLGHGTEDFWEEATFLVMRTLKLPFDRLQAFWEAHLTPEELEEDEEPDALPAVACGFVSPSILTTLALILFKSTPRFSKTRAATPSPSRIKPRSKCSVPI